MRVAQGDRGTHELFKKTSALPGKEQGLLKDEPDAVFWGFFLGVEGGAGALCISCCRSETPPAQDGAPPHILPGSGLRSLPSSLAAGIRAKK